MKDYARPCMCEAGWEVTDAGNWTAPFYCPAHHTQQ